MFLFIPTSSWSLLMFATFPTGLSSHRATQLPYTQKSILYYAAKPSAEPVFNHPSVGISVPEIARQVSVRILTNSGSGSGVIIERRGETYTVLTNHHVVEDGSDNYYTVLSADGQMHSARWLRSVQFGTLDLALVQFTSDQDYKVVAFGNPNTLSVGDSVYAAGFPSWHFIKEGNTITALEDTRNWGVRAFRLTTGTVGMFAERSLQGGYQLGYTNDVVQGMSGGPVLNQNGELIGINGKSKYPLGGIEAFIFANGMMPSEKQFLQMEALSWAIPITNFQPRFGQIGK
ncbi:S1 family peptidase [Scytonema sp. PRP1]|uniref:S1 family peptidase n=1 Tax=Scytonema sp. PRP1 TaxID=3120513 RepID=UPI00300CE6AC